MPRICPGAYPQREEQCLKARLVSNFIQTPVGQRAHSSGIREGAMHDSRRYRDSAAKCLLAAEEACQPYYRKLHLSMAASWLSLARQDEAIDNLVASWDLVHDPQTFVSGNRL